MCAQVKPGRTLILSVAIAAVVAAVLAAGLNIALTPKITLPPATEPPRERVVWVGAIEIKGSTTIEKLAPPPEDPSKLGPAFEFKWLDPEKKTWQVSNYMFSPATIIVNQGDKVKMKIFGVNGDKHLIVVDRYAEVEKTLNRGRLLDIEFTADTAGMFEIICNNHNPAMRGWLIVLPRIAY